MTIGVYSITNSIDDKRYIGKSINIEARFWTHRNMLQKEERCKDCNRHLFNAVKKHGLMWFDFEILCELKTHDEALLADLEIFYMDAYDTCNREHGYNLRRDSSTKTEQHSETIELKKKNSLGISNPNYGNKWSDEQKLSMSVIAKNRHADGGIYDQTWKDKLATASIEMWSDLNKRKAMAAKVKIAKRIYTFIQCTKDHEFIAHYDSVDDIILCNPSFKWQKIYQACSGCIKTYKGFTWIKIPKQ